MAYGVAELSHELEDIGMLGLVLFALWASGVAGGVVKAPLVGEIVCGMLLGPHCAGVVPYDKAALLVGNVGLVLLVMEGGLSVQLGELRRVGRVATAIAATGTLLPCLLGMGTMCALGYSTSSGLAAGVALSSTSIGMATKMLQDAGELATPLGALICVAAMVDDVLSLVILAVMTSLAGDGERSGGGAAAAVLAPVGVSAAVVLLGYASVNLTPKALEALCAGRGEAFREAAVLGGMLALTLGLTVGAGYVGSTHLLGAFAGGMSFAKVPGAVELWERHAGVSGWLSSVFFLGIGMQIPAGDLFTGDGVGVGLLYTVPAVLGKLCTGALLYPAWRDAAVVGFAMVGRGELGFVMAQEARDEGLMGRVPYVAAVWALLIATLASPVLTRGALAAKHRASEEGGAGEAGPCAPSKPGVDAYQVGSSTNIKWHEGSVSLEEREAAAGQRGCVLWFTGLSGAGKSTVAYTLEHLLHGLGRRCVVLDGDNIRHGLNSNLGFSEEDRKENIRRVGEVAKLFADASLVVAVSFISPYRADRDAVRERVGDRFVEVYMKVPIEVCEGRDPKGLYKAARAGKIKGFTGIDDPYEEPRQPEVTIEVKAGKGNAADPAEMAAQLLTWLEKHGYLKERAPRSHRLGLNK